MALGATAPKVSVENVGRSTGSCGRIAMLLVITLFLGGIDARPTAGQEVLTNDSVISLVKAGIPESVILAKIRSSQTKFDTTTKGLIALKQAGVSDKVLEAMATAPQLPAPVAAQSAVPTQAPPPPPPVPGGVVAITPEAIVAVPPPAGAFRARGTVYHLGGETYIELPPNAGEIQSTSTPFGRKSELVLHGRQAQYRTTERQPVFYSSYSASELQLARLKPGDSKDDRNLQISSGEANIWWGGGSNRRGIRSEDRIDVVAERDSQGWNRLKPRAPLAPGEYGFVVTHGFAGGATSGQLYDFGVD